MSDSNIVSYQFNTQFKDTYSSLQAPSFSDVEINDCVAYRVKSAIIPLSIYTIDSRNNKIYITETTSGAATATITSGYYTSVTFPAALKTALDAACTSNFTVSYSSLTNKLTFLSDNETFKFRSGVNNAYYECGINTEDLEVVGLTETPTGQLDLSGTSVINVVSNIGTNVLSGTSYKLLCSIVCDESQMSLATYENNSSEYYQLDTRNIDNITFSLYDNRMRQISLSKDFIISLSFIIQ